MNSCMCVFVETVIAFHEKYAIFLARSLKIGPPAVVYFALNSERFEVYRRKESDLMLDFL